MKNDFINKLKRAIELFSQTMEGREFVPKSKFGDEIIEWLRHPDTPGGICREELYYNESDIGPGGPVLDSKVKPSYL